MNFISLVKVVLFQVQFSTECSININSTGSWPWACHFCPHVDVVLKVSSVNFLWLLACLCWILGSFTGRTPVWSGSQIRRGSYDHFSCFQTFGFSKLPRRERHACQYNQDLLSTFYGVPDWVWRLTEGNFADRRSSDLIIFCPFTSVNFRTRQQCRERHLPADRGESALWRGKRNTRRLDAWRVGGAAIVSAKKSLTFSIH